MPARQGDISRWRVDEVAVDQVLGQELAPAVTYPTVPLRP